MQVSALTDGDSYFEDFEAGQKVRHFRGTTVGDIENQLLTKLVMNTAQGHFNEHMMAPTPFGGRIVFGLVTGSIIVGLATQDTAENAIREIGMTGLKFRSPVVEGDTLYALTEVLEVRDSDQEDAGIVRFKHWGIKQDDTIVFEGEREVLIKRRSHWGNR